MVTNLSNSSLFQLISKKDFNQLVAKWEMDKGVRSFSTWEMSCALVTCMTMRLSSFREVEQALGIPRSTLGDAMSRRCHGFFQDLCDQLLKDIKAKTDNRKVKKAIREILAIDASDCQIHGSLFTTPLWKQSNAFGHKASCKLHVDYSVDNKWVDNYLVTGSRQRENPISFFLNLMPNKIYVFDRGYDDIKFWMKIITSGSHFVTRLKDCKKNRALLAEVVAQNPDKDGVLFEGVYRPKGYWGKKQVGNKKFRHIIYRDSVTKKLFHFVTSDFKLRAQTVANIYKKRWAVELLFRWLKGHLDIRYLAVKNTNAVKIQLAIAVIIQLLLQLKKIMLRLQATHWEILREIRTNTIKRSLVFEEVPGGCRWKPKPDKPLLDAIV